MALLTGLIIFEGIYFIYSMKTNQELQRKKSHHKGETSPSRSIYSICVFSVVFFEQQEQPYAAIYFRHIHSDAHLMATSMLSNYGSSVYHRTGKIRGTRSIQTDRQVIFIPFHLEPACLWIKTGNITSRGHNQKSGFIIFCGHFFNKHFF